MTTALFQELTTTLGLLYALLLTGMFLRAKVPLFRRLLLPSSVIGGFLGLILGPSVMGDSAILPFSTETITTWSLIPGILILPIFASVPLGSGMEGSEVKSVKSNLPRVLLVCGLFSIAGGIQSTIGFGFTLVMSKLMPSLDLYRTFGFEMNQGFSGGHGTAGGLGYTLQSFDLDYWEVAQGVATTFATVGLIGGMLLGIFFINRGARTGKTQLMDSPSDLPPIILFGFSKDKNQQPSLGRETTNSSSIETITVHLGLIMMVSALSYYLNGLARTHDIFGLSSVPVWFYGLLMMYGVNFMIKKLGLEWLIDKKVKIRIVGALSDLAIVSAMASVNIKAVSTYLVPIIILSILGFLSTYVLTFPLYRYFFGKNDYYFERAIMSWGVNTGVTINGMMLLKICDPNYETPALTDFSMAFALMSLTSIFTYPITFSLIATGTTFQLFAFMVASTFIYIAMAVVGGIMLRKSAPEQFTA